MSHFVSPKVYMLAETKFVEDNQNGLNALLRHLGVPEWSTDAQTDAEALVEVGGRLCYKAFGTELNANITKVREGNTPYIENILKSRHGSVIEHAYVSFAIMGCSRIFTHELTRHRAGMAYSQESMRFVRLEDIPLTNVSAYASFRALSPYVDLPEGMSDTEWADATSKKFTHALELVANYAEEKMGSFSSYLDESNLVIPFSVKKKITSLLRRMAPNGHATNIMVTANHRAWRHIIEMRTDGGAEDEIRSIQYKVGTMLQDRYRALYQDLDWWPSEDSIAPIGKFRYSKV